MTLRGAVVRYSAYFGLLTFRVLIYVAIVESVLMPTVESFKLLRPSFEGDGFSAATLRDIMKAFSTVTNNTKEINYLIPNMFNLSSTDPTYVFRLPQAKSSNQSVLIMRRSDFAEPIFPNLTRSYIQLMQSKEVISKESIQDEYSNRVWEKEFSNEDNLTVLLNLQTERNFIEYVSELNRQDESMPGKIENIKDEWSLLGLDGWKGTLRPILRGYADSETSKPMENPAQTWDLPGKMLEDKFERNVMQVMANSNKEQDFNHIKYPITNMHADHSDADVYISRANDPFGHSTRWSMKNSSSSSREDERKKRAVIELYSMIKCSTGCDPIVFKGYGCYCGFLGSGQAVDGIDRCCKLHDKCYENSNCISYLEYFVPYLWKCYHGKPLCAIDHGEWGGPSSCAARLCACDSMLSRCLRQFVCPQKRAICRTSKSRMLQNILFNF